MVDQTKIKNYGEISFPNVVTALKGILGASREFPMEKILKRSSEIHLND